MLDLIEYGYIGLFIASFLAATLLPFSSEALLSLMIYSDFDIYICVIIATIGNTLGSILNYYLGRLGKWEYLEKYLKIKRERTLKLKDKVSKVAWLAALFIWLPIIGDIIAVALGTLKVNIYIVVSFTFIGKLLRYVVIAYLSLYYLA